MIGGFLLTRLSSRALLAVAAAWALARIAYLWPGAPVPLRSVLSLASTAAIALPAARGFLRGAKRAGSVVFPGMMLGFVAAEVLFQLGDLGLVPSASPGAWLGLGLVVLLIVAMGGRLVGAAASGAAQRGGGARIAPSPALEQSLLVLLALGFGAEALGTPGPLTAPPLAIAALLLGLRLITWLPGLRRSSGDVLALAAGQGWLCLGLLVRAIAETGLLPLLPSAALHLATVGGIGGTTLVMTMRASAQREARRMPVRAALLVAGLMASAALLRAFAPPETYAATVLLWVLATLAAARSVFARRR